MKATQAIRACFLTTVLILVAQMICTAQDVSSLDETLLHLAPSLSPATIVVGGQNFDGIGQNSFGFADPFIPPDPAAAVGTTQYIEWVNTSLAVFNKGTGEIVYGPIPGNEIWTSMGGPCASYNDGQPAVQFDKLANRWVIGQLVLHGPPYYFCVAVSKTDDGTPGNYYLYSIQFNDVPDSPRLGTWPDAYYVTFNMYSGGTFQFADVCALDRSSMLNGQSPRAPLCQEAPSQNSSLLPADIDGTTPPPSGSPNFLFSLGPNELNFWTFHVDFSQGTSQLNGPTPIPVQSFSPACSIINCIDQEGTPQHLTALSDRLMYRAAYRNFGDHESVTLNHTIIFALRYAAVRWYELRNVSTSPSVYQLGTYAPTFIHRWMGNVAMDSMGDMVAAYNFSSKTLHPSLSFTDRLAADPLGQLRGETLVMAGTGSQTSGAFWGNSTSLSVDPVDDCTFWSAGEYQRSDGSPNWNTRISSFSLTSCPSKNPAIQITSAPLFGQNGNLNGNVSNVNDYNKYMVGVLLFVPGLGWWSKPSCAQLFVPIGSDGTWSAWVGIGGHSDYTATRYVAYLLPQTANGTCHGPIDGLPLDLESQAVARAYYDRPNPGRMDLTFGGLRWERTDSQGVKVQPGGCYFSQDNAFLDGNNNLHLKITKVGSDWFCAQIIPEFHDLQYPPPTYGYGTYTFSLASAVDNLDPNVVLGLFTWSDDPAYADLSLSTSPWTNDPNGASCMGTSGVCPSHSELDVEFSKFGQAGNRNNAQFSVQPLTNNGAGDPFIMPPGYNNSTAIIYWFPDGISFKVQDQNGVVLASYTYPGPVPPPADNGGWAGLFPSPQQARLNLWLVGGNPPMSGQEVEIVVSNFTYTPYTR